MGITHFSGWCLLVGCFRVDEVQWRMKSALRVLLVIWIILVCGQVMFSLEADIWTGFRDIVSEVNVEEVLSSFCFLGAGGVSFGFMVEFC